MQVLSKLMSVNLCLFHSLYSGKDVEFQETDRISRSLVLTSFHHSNTCTVIMYKDVSIINVEMSLSFMTSCLDCLNYTNFTSNSPIFSIFEDFCLQIFRNTHRHLVFHMLLIS